ncbi:uncharacterized protein LOC106637661 [Copidosoma floridanum]|uniref:uncharacterized protein LOC106637661 n=1 Tax=Copidosoma floridanum TaxID=29053 RepID=UPI0006C94730|nr:uncharacterized protein LOC106637661 [Copidosoma floridanum]
MKMEYKILIACLFGIIVECQNVSMEEMVKIPCSNDSNCVDIVDPGQLNPKCKNNLCICSTDTTNAKWKNCTPRNPIVGTVRIDNGLNCNVDGECQNKIKGAICDKMENNTVGVCKCSENFTMDGRKKQCLKIADALGSECVDNNQCVHGLGESTKCSEGSCRCRENNHHYSLSLKNCVANKGHGEKCKPEGDNCYLLNKNGTNNDLECSDEGVCTCSSNRTLIDGLCSGASHAYSQIIMLLALVQLLAFL